MNHLFKRTMTAFFLIIAVSITVYSQDQSSPHSFKNEVRLGIHPLIRGSLNLNYERTIKNTGIVLIGDYTNYHVKNENITGGMGEVQLRYYLLTNIKGHGLYTACFGSYREKKIKDTGYTDNIISKRVGFLIGYKKIISERLVLDMNAGGANTDAEILSERRNYDYNKNMFSPGYAGVHPVANFTVGVVF